MNRLTRIVRWAVVGLLAFTAAGQAGPISEFESSMRAAYADYRAALFETNRKDKAATEAAMSSFDAKWRDLSARWANNPPPHFSEDAGWRRSLDNVARIVREARSQATAGELARAHDTLEAIRDEIGTLRARNGLITFSDRMNVYHEKMEQALQRTAKTIDAAVMNELRDDAAVLSFLVVTLREHRPPELGSDAAFEETLKAVEDSVKGLGAASRAGDVAVTKAALQKLKPAYSRLFLRYG